MTRIKLCFARAAATGALALAPAVASAAWTNIYLDPYFSSYISEMRVCKTSVNSMYGLLWRVNYQVFRRDGRTTSIAVVVTRYPNRQRMHRQDNDQWLYGVVAGTGGNAYASPFYDDRFDFTVFFRNGIVLPDRTWTTAVSFGGSFRPSDIANC